MCMKRVPTDVDYFHGTDGALLQIVLSTVDLQNVFWNSLLYCLASGYFTEQLYGAIVLTHFHSFQGWLVI